MVTGQLRSCPSPPAPPPTSPGPVPYHLGFNFRGRRKKITFGGWGGAEAPTRTLTYVDRMISSLRTAESGMSSLPMASRILILGKRHVSLQQAVSNLKLNSLKPTLKKAPQPCPLPDQAGTGKRNLYSFSGRRLLELYSNAQFS